MANTYKQETIEQMLNPIIKAIDSIPEGEDIPSTWEAPEGYKVEKFQVEGISVEHLIPNKKTNRVIYQIHGGGYVVGFIDAFRECAVSYSQAGGDAEVFSIDYRIAPKYHYPAALEDAVKVYKWILENGYNNNNIVIVGDSAGGNLTLATTLYLKDNNIPLPAGVIGVSVWGDMGYPEGSRQCNLQKDLLLGSNGLRMQAEVKNPKYLKANEDKKNPYISPVYGDYKGFPDLLLQVGSYEVLLDDCLKVANEAKKAGVNVSQTTYEGMSHDFQLLLPQLDETKKAWVEISEFMNKCFTK